MIKGVTIGEHHSFNDWGLRLRPYSIPLPEPKYNYLDNAGGNGRIDATEALGEVCYSDRIITLELEKIDRNRSWNALVASVANAIHGKKLHVTFDEDPLHYYNARCNIVGIVPTGAIGTLTVELTCDPFKYQNVETIVSVNVSNIPTTVSLRNLRMPVCPTIVLKDECIIHWGQNTRTLSAGTHLIPELRLPEGVTQVTVTYSNASMGLLEGCVFKYRQGSL